MPGDYFLHLVDSKTGVVKGESQDSVFSEEIDVVSFNIQVTGPLLDAASASDGGSCTFHEAEFVVMVSAASNTLFTLCCTGEILKTVTLTCRKAGAGKLNPYLQWRFHRAQISDYTVTGSAEMPTESIKVRYAKVEMAYTKQKGDGSMDGAPRTAGWDTDQNAALKATLPHTGKK